LSSLVSNKIFGVVLSAYMDGLCANIAKSKKKVGNTQAGSHKSIDQWEVALVFANNCRDKFEEPVASHQDIEDRANRALELLTKR
jgi:hypothetical protein